MKSHSIYILTNVKNGKKYVGQTSNVERRRREHFGKPLGNTYLSRAIIKHGHAAFSFRLLGVGMTREEADFIETGLIKKLGTLSPNGYNLVGGGNSGGWSDESSRRLSASLLVALKTPEARRNRSIGQSARRRREKTDGYVHPHLSQEAADRRRVQLARFREDPILQALRKQRAAASCIDPDVKMRRAASLKIAYADPSLRAQCLERIHSPSARAKAAATMRIVYSDKRMLETRNAAIRDAHSTPERRALRSEMTTRMWANPGFRERRLAANDIKRKSRITEAPAIRHEDFDKKVLQ